MEKYLNELIDELIQEVEQELEEATTTGYVKRPSFTHQARCHVLQARLLTAPWRARALQLHDTVYPLPRFGFDR